MIEMKSNRPLTLGITRTMRLLPLLALPLFAACVAPTASTDKQPTAAVSKASTTGGLPSDAVVGVASMDDAGQKLVMVMFLENRVSATQLAAAPSAICASQKRSLASSEVKPLEHPEDMPGARKLVVRCD